MQASESDAVEAPVLTIAGEAGGVVTATALVDGTHRMPAGVVPSPYSDPLFRCGGTAERQLEEGNYAYVEVKNPGDRAASVSLSVDGPRLSIVNVFAYASAAPPSTAQAGNKCLAFDTGYDGAALPEEVLLSSKTGNALVVPAHASVYALMTTSDATGAFKLQARTEALGDLDRSVLTLPRGGGPATTTVLVGGGQRMRDDVLPRTAGGNFRCGRSAMSQRGGETFAFVEVKNPNEAASVNVSVEGPMLFDVEAFGYASPTPPANADEASHCLTFARGYKGPDIRANVVLSTSSANALVVPAGGSAYVLVSTAERTGVYTIRAFDEAHPEPADAGVDASAGDAVASDGGTTIDAGAEDASKADASAAQDNAAGAAAGASGEVPRPVIPGPGAGRTTKSPASSGAGSSDGGCSAAPVHADDGAGAAAALALAVGLGARRRKRAISR